MEEGVPDLTPDETAPRAVPPDALHPAEEHSGTAAGSAPGGSRSVTPNVLPGDGGGSHRQGYTKSYSTDRYSIDTTWVEAWIDFYWGNGYVTGLSCWHKNLGADRYTGWLGPYNVDQNCSYGTNQSSGDSSTFARYENSVFCSLAPPTRVDHNRALVRGQNWGVIQGNDGIQISGGCSYLLLRNYKVVYTI